MMIYVIVFINQPSLLLSSSFYSRTNRIKRQRKKFTFFRTNKVIRMFDKPYLEILSLNCHQSLANMRSRIVQNQAIEFHLAFLRKVIQHVINPPSGKLLRRMCTLKRI